MNPPTPSPRHARQALKWIVRQGSGDFDARDQRRLDAWLQADPRHRAAYRQQQAFWRSVERAGPGVLAALPELAAAPVAARAAPRRRWPRPALAMAAVLLLAVALSPRAWLALRSDLRAGAQPQAFVLQDGSRAFLDAGAALAVDFDQAGRRIELLRGRAWFQVAHEPRPFRVAALGGEIRDIGTAFAVAVDGEQVTSAVSEGRIEVAAVAGDRRRVQLGRGQQVRYRRGGPLSMADAVAPAEVAPWRQGEILLDAVPARQAIAQIARYRRAPVWVLGDLAADPITATFHTGTPDEAIRAVAGQAGLQVRRLPGGVLVLTSTRR